MNSIRTDYTALQDGRVNEWEIILGRLEVVGDEINRALNWTTSTEEPGSGTGIVRTPYTICRLEQKTMIADI